MPRSFSSWARSRFVDECTRAGVHVVTETVRPRSKGRRYVNSRNGVTIFDGPFVETKELLGGYVVLSAPSLDAMDPWARGYMDAVQPPEADVFELE